MKGTIITPKAQTINNFDALKEKLPVGTTVEFELDGNNVKFEVAHNDIYGATNVFILCDCFDEAPMNKANTNEGGYAKSYRAEYLAKLFDKAPDELKAIVKEREIKQRIHGKTFSIVSKFWTPSTTEMFGYDLNETDVDDVHFDLYSTEKSRVKECEGFGTWWYALRSPTPTNSSNFDGVYANGTYGNDYGASNRVGVCFGFLV